MLRALLLALAATLALPAWAGPKVVLETSQGEVTLELDADKAPRTVENFLAYVREGHYNGTLFHRVIPDFMVQGGGFTPDFVQKPARPAIQNEANNGLKNARGTLAMARTGDPHSATAQFFINTVDNGFLDHQAPTPRGWGYAVFGKVINGMDVVDRIQRLPTGSGGPFRTDVPREAVLIKQARLLP